MAITLDTLPTPTILAIGDSAAGGTLTPGATWYFRVVAVKGGTSYGNQHVDSPWMTEASHTLGVGKTAIDISWNVVAGATRYYVLVTQVSGNYDETVDHQVINGAGQAGTTFTWGGAWPSSYFRKFWYRPSGVAAILNEGAGLVHAGTLNDPLDMEDVYAADIAGGWGLVKPQTVTNNVEYGGGTPRPGLLNSWTVDASMVFGNTANCYFREYNSDILVLGALLFSNTYTLLFQLGYRSGTKMGDKGCELRVRGTCDITLKGVCNIYGSSMIAESNEYADWNRAPVYQAYAHTWKRMILKTDISATAAWVSSRFQAWQYVARYETGSDLNNNYIGGGNEGISAYGMTFENAIVQTSRGRAFYCYHSAVDGTHRDCKSLYGNAYGDIRWEKSAAGRVTKFIDCTFNSKNQGNQDPYGYWRPFSKLSTGVLRMAHNFNPVFVDKDTGAVLVGYTVVLVDAASGAVISDTTDANGMLTGGAVDVTADDYTCDALNVTSRSAYLSAQVSDGLYIRTTKNPHTLTVSKDGTDYLVAAFNVDQKIGHQILVNITPSDPSADIERYELLKHGTTCYRDKRVRAGGTFSFESVSDALIAFERWLHNTTRYRDWLVRAGLWP